MADWSTVKSRGKKIKQSDWFPVKPSDWAGRWHDEIFKPSDWAGRWHDEIFNTFFIQFLILSK
jgi:hypothetical protein